MCRNEDRRISKHHDIACINYYGTLHVYVCVCLLKFRNPLSLTWCMLFSATDFHILFLEMRWEKENVCSCCHIIVFNCCTVSWISIGQFDSPHCYSSIEWSFTTLDERIVHNSIFNFLLRVIQRNYMKNEGGYWVYILTFEKQRDGHLAKMVECKNQLLH